MADGSGSWFSFLQPVVAQVKADGRFERFRQFTNNYERIKFCISQGFIKNTELVDIYSQLQDHSKNEEKASALKQLGNKYFEKKQAAMALDLYNKAVMLTPKHSTQFSICLANRSAVLFEQKAYKECVGDIKLALAHCYPTKLHHKIKLRLAQCYIAQEMYVEAIDMLNQASADLTSHSEIDEDGQVPWRSRICDNLKLAQRMMVDGDSDSSLVPAQGDTDSDVPLKAPFPPTLAQTGQSKVVYSNAMGRHLVAKNDIEAGDVVVREKPFASILISDYLDTRCHHCYAHVYVVVPCGGCSQVRYCSPACAEHSWQDYHQFECGYLDFCHAIGVAHLALRVVLTAGIHNISHILDRFGCICDDDRVQQIDTFQNAVDKCSSYSSVYHLLTHSEQMHDDDLFNYCLTSAAMLKFLEKTNFLPADCGPSLKEFVGFLLLTHMQQLICNANAITELMVVQQAPGKNKQWSTSCKESATNEETTFVRVGTAIYPLCSLINHACEPNIIHTFTGNETTVRAVTNIKEGQPLLNCYGPHFACMSTVGRRRALEDQYYFQCNCHRCVDGSDFEGLLRALKCQHCAAAIILPENEGELQDHMSCNKCKKDANIRELVKRVFESHKYFVCGEKLLDDNKFEESLTQLQLCYSIRNCFLYKQNMERGKVIDLMAKCLAFMGRHAEAAEYVAESVELVQHQFGSNSIELANELQKLSDLKAVAIKDSLQSMMSQMSMQEKVPPCDHEKLLSELSTGIVAAKHAEVLLDQHYGREHINAKEIRETLACLTDIEQNSTSVEELHDYLNSKLIVAV